MSPVVPHTGFMRRRRPVPVAAPAPPAAPARPASSLFAADGSVRPLRDRPSSSRPIAPARPVPTVNSGTQPPARLDLSRLRPQAPAETPRQGGVSLSLDDGPPDAEVASTRRLRTHAPLNAAAVLSSLTPLGAGETVTLNPCTDPVRVLNRLRSGAGVLHIELAQGSPETVTLGCVYADADGAAVVTRAGAPLGPTAPVVHTGAGEILVNLRQVRHLSRFLVYAARARHSPWAGATIGSLGGRTSLRMPLASENTTTLQGVLTGHTVDGQLVLRAEADHIDGPLQQLCENHGYELTWVTPDTPLT